MSIDTPSAAELEIAIGWYEGSGSMLYAIASTGSLSRGDRRPLVRDDDAPHTREYMRPAHDTEWDRELLWRLSAELRMLLRSQFATADELETIAAWLERIDQRIADIDATAEEE